MDLSAAEILNGRAWSAAKVGAFVCFGVACGFMIASLYMASIARAELANGSRAIVVSAKAH